MDTRTDTEFIKELASRHDELVVVRPRNSNMAGSKDQIMVFCKTKSTGNNAYDLYEAIELLHEAQVGLMRDCIVNE
jgi:hypothetical protein